MGILSIQSHVSYGHVGNAAAVFVLRRLGFDVWPVHTVLFSNHPGYGDFGGIAIGSETVQDIMRGLEARGVFGACEAVIGGYLGSAGTGAVMLDVVRRIKAVNPTSGFYLDPVLGDRDTGVYVADNVVEFYRNYGLGAADVVKANAFELEVLSGVPVLDLASARDAAMTVFNAHGARTVVVTSIPAGDGSTLVTAAISKEGVWVVETPVIPVEQKGTGDAFMALLVANDLNAPEQMGKALAASVSAIWSLIRETCEHGAGELLLVNQQRLLLEPTVKHDARWLEHSVIGGEH